MNYLIRGYFPTLGSTRKTTSIGVQVPPRAPHTPWSEVVAGSADRDFGTRGGQFRATFLHLAHAADRRDTR